MNNIFDTICKKCEGKCCKYFEIFLLKKELENLKEFKDKLDIKKQGSGFLMCHEDKCFFKNHNSHCILKEKPFDCNLFPLAFIYKNNKLKFYLMKECPYIEETSKEGIENTKKWVIKELKTWTEQDKLTYSKIIEGYNSSELKEV